MENQRMVTSYARSIIIENILMMDNSELIISMRLLIPEY